jgi:uncharacterized repeat protein (TIGR01451 family)
MSVRFPVAKRQIGAACMAVAIAAFGQAAVPQTPAGTEVVNIAQITWFENGGEQGTGLAPAARFTVARGQSQGVLSAWELDRGLSDVPVQQIYFPAGDYRVNPFIPLPEPVDTSELTGAPTPIDRSAPLRVFRTDRIRVGVPVFFSLEDAGLNRDPTLVETVVVVLNDAATSDREEVRFYETGVDTGVFTAWINTTDQVSVAADGQLSTRAHSVITAQYSELTNVMNSLELAVSVGAVDPFGLVFDSQTGAPLSGIELILIDMATGQPAVVFGDDMVSRYPSRVITGGQVTDSAGRIYNLGPGEYRFPYVAPGTYRFEIGQTERDTHAAPSLRSDAALQSLPGAPFGLGDGARLLGFDVVQGPPVRIDIPMDALTIAQVTRTASHAEAGIGDFIEYTVTVTPEDTDALTLRDTLPAGIAFLVGTFLVDGQPAPVSVSQSGRTLDYTLPSRPADRVVTITYGAQVVPPAQAGLDFVSTSQIMSPRTRPARAEHRLRLKDAFGLDQVAILGQISAGGCTGPSPEYDLSGIRVLLENGEFAITDSDGRFTFRDIYRRPRVVQMDVTTLPAGTRPVLCYASTRSAGSPISQFVDLRPGMMGRVEFFLEFDDEDERLFAPAMTAGVSDLEQAAVVRFDQNWLDKHAPRHGTGFVTPINGYSPRSEAIEVVYLRPVGTQSELRVNGEKVPAFRREPVLRSADGRWELLRYRAARVGEGRNMIALDISKADGQPLHQQQRAVLYGVRPAHLDLVRASSVLESDGRSQPQITMRLTDPSGIPIRPGLQVSLKIEAPFGFAPLQPVRRSAPASERASQSRISATVQDDGLLSVALAPVLEGGTARISIATTGRDLNLRVPISAASRPWVLVGLAEGTLAHRQVRAHMRRDGEIGNALSGRVALFADGVIKGEWLLTLRYDSAQDRDSFYGIDPDADYVVYGDRSTQGNVAQSRFPLYLRLRREGAEFLIGDFNTNLNAGGVAINQQVTGARAVFENEQWRVMAFAAQSSNRLVSDRIALNGTIGPYQLSRVDVIPHSQTLRLITVSRFDASEELDSRTLAEGVDYVVSYTTGQIFLRRPVPAFTVDLHRHVLVADYEADADLRNSLIAGIRVDKELGPRLRVGATVVHARRVEGQNLTVTLAGVDLEFQATDDLKLSGDILTARRNFVTHSDTGLRSEVRLEFKREGTEIAAYLRRQRGHVALTAATKPIDTSIAGLRLRHKLWAHPDNPSEAWVLEAHATAENDRANATRKRDAEVLLTRERAFKTQSIGFRVLAAQDSQGQTQDLRLVYRGTGVSEDGRLTQVVGTEVTMTPHGARVGDKLELTFGYAVTERWNVFGTFEAYSPRQTRDEARRATVGIEFSPADGRNYRAALSWAGNGQHRGHALFLGADYSVRLRDGLSANLGGDVQWDRGAAGVPIGQSIGNPFIAESFVTLRGGLRFDAKTWGAGLDSELRRTPTTQTGNLRLRIDGELSDHWSAAGEAFFGLTKTGSSWKRDTKLLVSAAHRAGARDPITLLQGELRQTRQNAIDTLTLVASLYRSQYLSDTEYLNLRYGLKYDRAKLRTGVVQDLLSLAGAEYRRDLNDKFDVGLHASILHSVRTGGFAHSFGLSFGLTPFHNGWLSVGYNFAGFLDPDFSTLGHTNKGPFIQYRMKFDTDTLRGMFK